MATRSYTTRRRRPVSGVQNYMASKRTTLDGGASEIDAIDDLTDFAIKEDMDWVRGVVAREVRRQLFLPEDEWDPKDLRDERIARLRAQGLSFRQIAEHLGVGVATVHRALARREEVAAVVKKLPFQKSVPGRSAAPPLAGDPDALRNADLEHATITPLRRSS